MTRVQIGIILGATLLFGFQNCKKSEMDVINSGNEVQSAPPTEIELSKEQIKSVSFSSMETVTAYRNTKPYSLRANTNYTLDMSSGELVTFNEATEESKTYCVDQAKLSELQNLLSNSKVCRPHPIVEPERVCTMVLVMGYADIVTNREVFRLGTQVENSCGLNDLLDLCDRRGVDLQAWFQEIKSNLSQHACVK